MKLAIYSDEKIEFFNRATRDSSFKMPEPHFHNKHEMYFVEKGKAQYFVGSEIYFLTTGDMMFIPIGEFHKTDIGDSITERLLLVFDDAFLGSEYHHLIDELKKNKFIRIVPEKLYKIKEIYEKIEHEDKYRSENYIEMERLYLRELLFLIKRYRIKDTSFNLTETYKLIQSCATYITENYNQNLTLNFLAKKYSISRSHFSKLFKQITGINLNEYITITRISAAQNMLSNKKLSITEISELCGFNDSNYFATVFKKIKGITPKKYSLLYNKENQNK